MVDPSAEVKFPYFFVGTFIEAQKPPDQQRCSMQFPYFFVGTFIEALATSTTQTDTRNFPTFS